MGNLIKLMVDLSKTGPHWGLGTAEYIKRPEWTSGDIEEPTKAPTPAVMAAGATLDILVNKWVVTVPYLSIYIEEGKMVLSAPDLFGIGEGNLLVHIPLED